MKMRLSWILALFLLCVNGACGWVMSKPDFPSDTSEDGDIEHDMAELDGGPDQDTAEGVDEPTDPHPDEAPLDLPGDEIVVAHWPCRRPLEIDNSENTAALADFQLRVDVDHVDAMNADFSDIRFGNDGLVERYAYWIEETAGDGSRARVWVRVPSIAASAVTTIFMHFGNAGASDEGDPEAVFEFYDDFESGALDRWTGLGDLSACSVTEDLSLSGSRALSCSDLNAEALGGSVFLVAHGVSLADMVFESAWHVTSVNLDASQTFRSASSLPMDTYEVNLENDHWVMARIIAGEWSELALVNLPPPLSSWFRLSTIMVGSSARVLIDDVQVVPDAGWVNMGAEIASGSAGYKLYYISSADTLTLDDAWVRKAADPFPVSRWGDVECL